MCNIVLPLEIREHILRFSGNDFFNIIHGILGGSDVYHNYYSILERLLYKCKKVDKKTPSNIIFTIMLPNGLPHSSKQPSFVVKNKDGMIIKEEWYLFGKIGNINKDHVSSTSYYNDGTLEDEGWYYDDKSHRDNNLPAYIEYNNLGNITSELWCLCGKMGRTDNGVIDRRYRKNGMIKFETYQISLYNEIHSINYNENGNKRSEVWFKNDRRHRDNNLPAYREYHIDGKIKCERWYNNGNCIRAIINGVVYT